MHLKVSIIIPVYNTAYYLPQCLESIINQTVKEIDVICVNNGSTDNSLNILKDYQKKYDQIKVINHPSGRQGAARNAGIKIAKGEYIGFVDSDDYIEPDMFKKMYKLAQEKEAAIVICNIKNHYEENGKNIINFPESWFPKNNLLNFKKDQRFFRNHTICNKLFKRDFIVNNNLQFPSELFHEDVYFVMLAYFLAQKVVAVNEPLYVYRKRKQNTVNATLNNNAEMIFRIMNKLENEASSLDLPSEYKNSINEIKVYKYLSFYKQLRSKTRHLFFDHMKDGFKKIKFNIEPLILTPTEYKNFILVNNVSFYSFNIIFNIKIVFCLLLKIKFIHIIYIKFKRLSKSLKK